MNDIDIKIASAEDAKTILELQKLAYLSEAEIINDFKIPPLQQTLEEVIAEFDNHLFLKAMINGQIIGSVRVYEKQGTGYIGKLIVHPNFQNQGIGTLLLKKAEGQFPGIDRYELFTGQKSERNLYFYDKHGYTAFKEKKISEKLTLIFLEKLNK